MICIYIDESGDLGFRFLIRRTNQYYTLAAIRVKDPEIDKKLKRVMKKVRQRKLKKKHNKLDELKFSNTNDVIRKVVLKEIAKLDLRIYSLTIFKKNVKNVDLKNKPHVMYGFLMRELCKRCLSGKIEKPLYMHIDRFLPRDKQEEFKDYITVSHAVKLKKTPKIDFLHEDSKRNPAIQAVDFVAGAIQYKYAHSDRKDKGDYIEIIEDKLSHREYFNNKR